PRARARLPRGDDQTTAFLQTERGSIRKPRNLPGAPAPAAVPAEEAAPCGWYTFPAPSAPRCASSEQVKSSNSFFTYATLSAQPPVSFEIVGQLTLSDYQLLRTSVC